MHIQYTPPHKCICNYTQIGKEDKMINMFQELLNGQDQIKGEIETLRHLFLPPLTGVEPEGWVQQEVASAEREQGETQEAEVAGSMQDVEGSNGIINQDRGNANVAVNGTVLSQVIEASVEEVEKHRNGSSGKPCCVI